MSYICFILEHHVHRGKSESITIKDEEGHSTHSASMAVGSTFHSSVVARILPCMGFGKKTCPNLVPLLNGTTTALSGTNTYKLLLHTCIDDAVTHSGSKIASLKG